MSTFPTTGPPIHSCFITDRGTLSCAVTETCDHSMDLGVMCGSLVATTPEAPTTTSTAPSANSSKVSTTISPRNIDLRSTQFPPRPTCPTVTCPTCDFDTDCPTRIQARSCDHCYMLGINDNSSAVENPQQIRFTDLSHTVLFIIIGVLCILLLIMIIGWICTYAILKKRLMTSTSNRLASNNDKTHPYLSLLLMRMFAHISGTHRDSKQKQEVLNPIYTQTTLPGLNTNRVADFQMSSSDQTTSLELSTCTSIENQRSSSEQRMNTYDAIVNTRGQEIGTRGEDGEYTTIAGRVGSMYNALVHNGYPLQQDLPILDGHNGDYSKLRQSQTIQSHSI